MKYDFLLSNSAGIPVSESYIAQVEEEYGIRFPDPLRVFFLENNGRKMSPAVMEIDGVPYWVEDILAFKDLGLSMELVLKRQRMQHYPVRQMIPFADDGDGIYYCHMLTGAVYLSHLEGDKDFFWICSSVEQFFSILNEAYLRDEENPYDISEITRSDEQMTKFDFLPLGSIVLLKGGTRKVMIIARGMNVKRENETYFFDYGGVLYPDGLTGDQMVYFDHDGVVKVYFHGYRDDEDDVIQTALAQYLDDHPNINRADPLKWNPGLENS